MARRGPSHLVTAIELVEATSEHLHLTEAEARVILVKLKRATDNVFDACHRGLGMVGRV